MALTHAAQTLLSHLTSPFPLKSRRGGGGGGGRAGGRRRGVGTRSCARLPASTTRRAYSRISAYLWLLFSRWGVPSTCSTKCSPRSHSFTPMVSWMASWHRRNFRGLPSGPSAPDLWSLSWCHEVLRYAPVMGTPHAFSWCIRLKCSFEQALRKVSMNKFSEKNNHDTQRREL